MLADIAIGLAGIAAEDRHKFGNLTSGDFVVSWFFTAGQIHDFTEARDLVESIDPTDDGDVLFQIWRQAIDLVADASAWRMIESLATALGSQHLNGTEIDQIAGDVLDSVRWPAAPSPA